MLHRYKRTVGLLLWALGRSLGLKSSLLFRLLPANEPEQENGHDYDRNADTNTGADAYFSAGRKPGLRSRRCGGRKSRRVKRDGSSGCSWK